jgi:GH15 family glucan-1,4-alpha-glucosidase
MAYKPISDYGVIGDMHSAALIASDGSVDWLCFPRFDSPSVFAAILDDARGGRFRIRPLGQFSAHQRYLSDSNVLVTEFRTDSGAVTLTDFMPVEDDIRQCHHTLVRMLRCEEGSVEMEVLFEPRLDYARGKTDVTVNGRAAVARHDVGCLSLSSGALLEQRDDAAAARLTLRSGQWTGFVLTWGEDSPAPVDEIDIFGSLGRTQAFWRFVAQDWRYSGRWADVVRRSMLALHLLIYAPTGAVCAAATTSLPEAIGGPRNWDYRFCWLRDAAFTLDIFNRLGHTTYTRPFIDWMANLAFFQGNGRDIHALYSIAHSPDERDTREEILEHLEGYRGSRPVRIGNAAYGQFQLDVFGEVLLSFDSFLRAGGVLDERLWKLAECLVEEAIERWRQPDTGIWEFRTEPRHFTYSKVMAWVAVDRGLKLAKALRCPVDYDRWRRARSEIREDILRNGWKKERNSFVQHYDDICLDASLLFIPMVGFLPGDDPRVHSTIDAIWKELGQDGLIYRYIPAQSDDGLPGDEGTFTMCTLWLCGALIAADRVEEARSLFERVLGMGNHLGLFSEMLDPHTGEYLGNYPQAFTHIALIHTARNLDRALSRVPAGKVVLA